MGLGALPPISAAAKDRKKKRKNGATPNIFGCLDVGKKCRGKDSKCCSSICQGKKPKKGKRDTSKCVGHDESTCLAGHYARPDVFRLTVNEAPAAPYHRQL